MRIVSVEIKNYRTIEHLEVQFSGFYHALSGPNDSGKSNVIRAIAHVLGHEEPFNIAERQPLRLASDFPKWLSDEQSKEISISVVLEIESTADAGVYNFLSTYLKLDSEESTLIVTACVFVTKDKPIPQHLIRVGDLEFKDDLAQEAIKRLQGAPAMYFHNSTDYDGSVGMSRLYHGMMSETAFRDNQAVKELNTNIRKVMSKVARSHQEKLGAIFGRLDAQHRLSLSMPAIEMASIPYTIVLESGKATVPLHDWGSGTRNKTQILLALFNAIASKDLENTSARVSPIVVVEEPESFLHSSAQAEFGRLLQDLAEEFKLQIIATTHSPFMLSQREPESNVLFAREKKRGHSFRTYQKETKGDNWMQPFGEALGIASREFVPWKDALFSANDDILLVEGVVDKQYFEMLQDESHGKNRLLFDGLIFAYDGCDNLKNQTVLKLVQEKFKTSLVTFDLDAKDKLVETFERLNLKENTDYFAVGVNEAGKRDIEGLLPKSVHDTVYGAHSDLVQALGSNITNEKKAAKNKLKSLLLEEFRKTAKVGDEAYAGFYRLVRLLNTAIRKNK